MRKKIISNIISSGVEKTFLIATQFISSIFLIRLLPRDDYGIIGIVAGYYAFINIINISMESIILRDHHKYVKNLSNIIFSFYVFNLIKSVIYLLVASVLSIGLAKYYGRYEFVYAIFSITFIMIANTMATPYIIYFTSKFNQKIVTKINIGRASFNLVFLLGLFYMPTLAYIAFKDFVLSLLYIWVWFFLAKKYLFVNFYYGQKCDWKFLRNVFFSYSLWSHLNGVATNIIYRSDTFFLAMFAGLAVVGDYNISLNSANIANVLPMIIGYQNSVALSNVIDKELIFKISNSFVKVSLLIGVLTWVGFAVCGPWYLRIITGQANTSQLYFYMMCIVTGLIIVKSIASPLVAYINIHGSVKMLVMRVTLPIFILTLIIYYCSGKYYYSNGLAVSNILVSLIWLALVICEAKRSDYVFRYKKMAVMS